MANESGVELKLENGDKWIRKALEDFEFRRDCYRQLHEKGWEDGAVAYEKNGTYRVGGSIKNAVALLQDTLLDGRYKYQIAPINARELLR